MYLSYSAHCLIPVVQEARKTRCHGSVVHLLVHLPNAYHRSVRVESSVTECHSRAAIVFSVGDGDEVGTAVGWSSPMLCSACYAEGQNAAI